MNKPLRLVGVLKFANLDFITAIPVFQKTGGTNSTMFRQLSDGDKISSFERVELSDAERSNFFNPLGTAILRTVGDPIVLVEANIGTDLIISTSIDEHRATIAAKLKGSGSDLIDPVLGLELADFVGDIDLIERFFRRVARAAFSIDPEVARAWAGRHKLKKTHSDLVDDALSLDEVTLSGVHKAASQGNVFAKHGFERQDLQYYCSSHVLDYLGLFEISPSIDPILIHTRPISELPDRHVNEFVVLVSWMDFSGSHDEVRSFANYVARGLKLGGSLVLLVESVDRKYRNNLSFGKVMSQTLDRISDALGNQDVSDVSDWFCILFSEEETSLRKAIRERTGPRELEARTALFSARFSA